MSFAPLFDAPDTSAYMIAGYVVFIVLPVLFIASLIYRDRGLKRDDATLRNLMEDDKK